MAEGKLLFRKKEDLVPPYLMENKDLWIEVTDAAPVLKAALIRAFYSSVEIGETVVTTPFGVVLRETFTADFTKKQNLRFFDRFYIPRLREVVGEGRVRGMETAMRQVLSDQGEFAVKLGRVSRFTFNEISGIIYPSTEKVQETAPAPEGNVILFPGPSR